MKKTRRSLLSWRVKPLIAHRREMLVCISKELLRNYLKFKFLLNKGNQITYIIDIFVVSVKNFHSWFHIVPLYNHIILPGNDIIGIMISSIVLSFDKVETKYKLRTNYFVIIRLWSSWYWIWNITWFCQNVFKRYENT